MPLVATVLEAQPDLLQGEASENQVGCNRLPTLLVVDDEATGGEGSWQMRLEPLAIGALAVDWRKRP